VRQRLDRPLTAALLAIVGGATGLLATSQTWARAVVTSPVSGGRVPVTVTGKDAAQVVVALALVALAGGVALLLARRLGRWLIGLLLVLAGAAGAASAASSAGAPSDAVSEKAQGVVGAVGTTVSGTSVTAWPWVAVVGGVLVVLAGVLAVVRARRWAVGGARFEPASDPVAGDALADAGVDRADRAAGVDGVGGIGVPSEAPEPPGPGGPGAAWDALSRGEDPTR
jgi:uncharacterized membrane protein (TIGR02234 family)